jgi:uncharacterized protein
MPSEVVDVPEAQRFEIRVGDEVAGFGAYRRAPDGLALTHTEIASRFEGQGLGSALAKGTLQVARDAGTTVLPYCPFLRSYLQRHPEWVQLVPEARRGEFALAESGSGG